MPRSDGFDKSPDEALPESSVIEADVLGLTQSGALGFAVIPTGGAAPPRTGAVALMMAVLEEAIRSCFSATPQVRAEAEAWLTSGQGRSIFSYLAICETLGLNAEATRAAIKRLMAMGSGRKPIRRTRTNVRHSLLASRRKRGRGSH